MITVAHLVACGLHPTQARRFADPLSAACAFFAFDTPARIAATVGQCRVESMDFTKTEEGLYYTSPERVNRFFSNVRDLEHAARLVRNPKALANCVYANRNGNGDEASGDGWKYRGRGLIQLTGRGNYADAEAGLARPYVDTPGLVAEPSDACLTAVWYLHNAKAHILADSWQIDAITRAVNGRAMLHADLRRQYSEEALRALS